VCTGQKPIPPSVKTATSEKAKNVADTAAGSCHGNLVSVRAPTTTKNDTTAAAATRGIHWVNGMGPPVRSYDGRRGGTMTWQVMGGLRRLGRVWAARRVRRLA
jgi:hypothetical protein